MTTKKGTVKFSFGLFVAPDGNVYEADGREAKIARRLVRGVEEYEEIELEPGGMIIMSTDVNATVGRGFVSWAKGFTRKWFNRFWRGKIVEKDLMRMVKERGMDTGWSVGNTFRGRYHNPKTGEDFDERSFTVDIRGVPIKFVEDVGKSLMKKFRQHSVMVVNHATGRPKLIFKR